MSKKKTSVSLDAVRGPVADELKQFNRFFGDSMRSKIRKADILARYIVRHKGERLRPILVLLSAKACGEINNSSYRAAALAEILHTAILVHDDVLDDADTRRGFVFVNEAWKNKLAVLLGDYLLSRGFLLALENDDLYFLESLSNAIKRISEGGLLRIQHSHRPDIDEATYLEIVERNTASLFSACAELGAASATQDTCRRNIFHSFGESLGFAFQLTDDVLDCMRKESVKGKAIRSDLGEWRLTLPLIHSLELCRGSKAEQIRHIMKDGATKEAVRWVMDLIETFGGITYSIEKAKAYALCARETIKEIPDSPAKQALLKLTEFAVQRQS